MSHHRIACEYVHINLLTGESESPEFLKLNPMGYVPALEAEGIKGYPGTFLITESLAMIRWFEQRFQLRATLLGKSPEEEAKVWQLAETINAGTQPLQNLLVLEKLTDDASKRKEWAQTWNHKGLEAYEQLVSQSAGRYSVGDNFSLADICLIPQCYNAKRFEIDLEKYPTVNKIYNEVITLDTYHASHPDRFMPEGFKP